MLVCVGLQRLPPIWLWAICGLALLAAFVARRIAERRRNEALACAASAIGFRLESPVLVKSDQELKSLPLLSHRFRRFKYVMLGYAAGGEVLLFDLQYNLGEHRREQTVAAFRWSAANLPRFVLRPECALEPVGHASGYELIKFDGFPDFSRRFRIRGPDAAAIRGYLTPAILEFFQACRPGREWSVEAGGRWLVVYRLDIQFELEKLPDFAEETTTVANVLYREVGRGVSGTPQS